MSPITYSDTARVNFTSDMGRFGAVAGLACSWTYVSCEWLLRLGVASLPIQVFTRGVRTVYGYCSRTHEGILLHIVCAMYAVRQAVACALTSVCAPSAVAKCTVSCQLTAVID